ncbi:bifunctional metallophosphatase/5'-nucleotidase [Halomicrobium urmianum]|uniref:bifunctional metallophosphatase/5'-nucleotidase n=1 Tax=Halomicrobium urmianum TaxID=1586233 RepID=UPI001CD9230E|nr:bifunctional metallophosphatase/5'-nucleotidase [Halomicrobium urmianum]
MPPTLLHYSDVENAYDDPDRIGRLAGRLRGLRDGTAVVCGTGDNTAPGVLSLVTEGRQALPFFEAVGTDFETFGNHDFDHGIDATAAVVRDSPQTWLTANVEQDGVRPSGARSGSSDERSEPPGVPSNEVKRGSGVERSDPPGERFLPEETVSVAVREVDGRRLGFVGVTTRSARYNPGAGPLSFEDPVPAVREGVATLREREVDDVVVLAHLGREDEHLARETDVDVVLGGHVHDVTAERIDGTVLTRPGVNGEVVFAVELGETVRARRYSIDDAPVYEPVAEALRDRLVAADLDEVVAHVADPIERSDELIAAGETRVGNLVADAYRWSSGADVGLQNSGGIRTGPPLGGDVTVADLVSVVPFEEELALLSVTGAELRRVVREASGDVVEALPDGMWNGHFSGLSVVWNDDDREIERLRVGGEPVDDDATYTVVTTEYLLGTDHEYPTLTPAHHVDSVGRQYDALADYARSEGIDPEIEGRIVRRGRGGEREG